MKNLIKNELKKVDFDMEELTIKLKEHIENATNENYFNWLKSYSIMFHNNAPLTSLGTLLKMLEGHTCANSSHNLQQELRMTINKFIETNIEYVKSYLLMAHFVAPSFKYKDDNFYPILRMLSIINSSFSIKEHTLKFKPAKLWNAFKQYNTNIEHYSYTLRKGGDTTLWKQQQGNFTRVPREDNLIISNEHLVFLPTTENTIIKPLQIFIGKLKHKKDTPTMLVTEKISRKLFVFAEVTNSSKQTAGDLRDLRLIEFNFLTPLSKTKAKRIELHWVPPAHKGKLLHALGTYYIVGFNEENEIVAYCHGHEPYIYPQML